ncbi:hypothetical protein ACQKCJ_22425 [Flavobacterium sp. NPDC079362]|uniref:hypothetical protein n=1 Tax=Flavobacterium sp. NPDC079362 TaxID=3390566 RepID=UPI003D00F7C3
MKKILLLLCIMVLFSHDIQGQAKQRKTLLLQISALQTYIGYAKKGYTVAKNGLNFIGDVKKGELNFHENYFSSLKKVNPKVGHYLKVASIISLQLKIIKIHKKTLENIHHDDLFHGDELDYIEKTFGHLIDNCNDTLQELLVISTDNKLEMGDSKRIERIQGLYKTMLEDYLFCENFTQEISLMSLSRSREKNDRNQSRILLGL